MIQSIKFKILLFSFICFDNPQDERLVVQGEGSTVQQFVENV